MTMHAYGAALGRGVPAASVHVRSRAGMSRYSGIYLAESLVRPAAGSGHVSLIDLD